jgi:hypothetical protein
MPDMERLTRNLELHTCDQPEAAALARGRQAGEDCTRWQVVKLAAVIAVVCIAITPYVPR